MFRSAFCAVAIATVILVPKVPSRSQTPDVLPAKDARVVLLGQGSPLLNASRSGTSVGIAIGEKLYVFDAGSGVERRIFELGTRHPDLPIKTVGPVFITHLHSDHTLGLPALLYHHGDGPLAVFGPPGIAAMMKAIDAAWSEDHAVRLEEDPVMNRGRWGLDAQVTEIAPGEVFRNDDLTVRAFEVPHAVWKHAFGYRIDAGGRSIVISGDVRPTDVVARACHGCDILFHEVYSRAFFDATPERRKPYHRHAHTSTAELAKIAGDAHPGLLILYHQLYGTATDDDLVREIREAGYTGRVVSARDLDIF